MLPPCTFVPLHPLHGVAPGFLACSLNTVHLWPTEGVSALLLVDVLHHSVGVVVDDQQALFIQLGNTQGVMQETNGYRELHCMFRSLVGEILENPQTNLDNKNYFVNKNLIIGFNNLCCSFYEGV